MAFRQFLSFSMFGAVALFVDAATLAVALASGCGYYLGRMISWTVAATCTWYLNRAHTFGYSSGRAIRQWSLFLAANSVGGMLNFGIYALAVTSSDTVRAWPVIGVAAGSLAGLVVNFALSKKFVFTQRC